MSIKLAEFLVLTNVSESVNVLELATPKDATNCDYKNEQREIFKEGISAKIYGVDNYARFNATLQNSSRAECILPKGIASEVVGKADTADDARDSRANFAESKQSKWK